MYYQRGSWMQSLSWGKKPQFTEACECLLHFLVSILGFYQLTQKLFRVGSPSQCMAALLVSQLIFSEEFSSDSKKSLSVIGSFRVACCVYKDLRIFFFSCTFTSEQWIQFACRNSLLWTLFPVCSTNLIFFKRNSFITSTDCYLTVYLLLQSTFLDMFYTAGNILYP